MKYVLPTVIGCTLLTLLAFGHALTQGFAPIDDHFLILNNLAIRGINWENLRVIFTTYDPELYIPLTLFSFQIDYLIGDGLSPAVFHATNLVLHAANAMLVGWLLTLLTRRPYLSLFAAFVFAVHPLHTEAVVWAAGRKDLLSAFWMLLAMIGYVYGRRGIPKAYVGSLACFLLALLSKAMAITLPAVLLLFDFLERRPLRHTLLIDKIPYAVLSSVFFVIAAAGKERILASSSLWETALMAARSTVFYLSSFLVPTGLTVYYPHAGPITLADTVFLVPTLILIALLGVCLWSLRHTRAAAFGFFFFLVTLSPTFFNFHKGAFFFFAVDRYAYVPSVGLLFLAVVGMGYLIDRIRVPRVALPAIGLVTLSLLVWMSRKQTATWDTPETLYSHALTLYPSSLPARLDLADLRLKTGHPQEAFDILLEGLQYGDNDNLRLRAGYIYARTGQVADAREQFEKAKTLNPENPEPVFALGSLLEQTGDPDAALPLYAQAVSMDPSYVAARVAWARLLLRTDATEDARFQLAEALQWNPHSLEAHVEMALLLASLGDLPAAMHHVSLANSLDAVTTKNRLEKAVREGREGAEALREAAGQ